MYKLSGKSGLQNDNPAFSWWRFYGHHEVNETALSIAVKSPYTLVLAGFSESATYQQYGLDYFFVNNFGAWLIGYGYHYGSFVEPSITRGFSVTMTSDEGLAVVGSTNSHSDNLNVLCIRARSSGWDIWDEFYGGSSDDEGYDIIECQSGGFAILGYTKSMGAGESDAWLIRIDDNGVPLWNKTYGGGADDVGTAIIECESGGFCLAGYTASYGAGSEDIWIIRTDESGNVVWYKTFGNSGSDFCYDIISTQAGGFCLVGSTQDPDTSIQQAITINTDADGDLLWDFVFSTGFADCANGIIECLDGGYATTGYTTQILSSGVSENLVIFRFDMSGMVQWIRTFGWEGQEIGYSLTQIDSGDFVACGSTSSNGTLDYLLVGFPDTEPPPNPPSFPNIFVITGIISAICIVVIFSVIYFKAIRSSSKFIS